MSEEEAPKGSIVPLFVWTVIVLMVGLGAIATMGIGFADSEDAAVMAAMAACPALGFAAATFLGALIAQIASKATVVRLIVPGVVGVLGGVAGGFLTMMFFAVLWPAL